MSGHVELGRAGEAAAEGRYRHDGYEIVGRNVLLPGGEIDLIVTRGELVVFVEVKTRRSNRHGGGASAVDHRKQRRLRAAAAQWLAAHDGPWRPVRFDVVVATPVGQAFTLELITDAF